MVRRTAKGYRVRRATLRDLGVLVRHRRGMWRDISKSTEAQFDAADPVWRRWARDRMRNGTLIAFVAVAPDGHAAASGCVWLRRNQPMPRLPDPTVPYLLSMYTEPADRGRGLATKIVEAALRWSRAKGFPIMILHASQYGRSLYEKLGFERTWEMRVGLVKPTRASSRGRATPRGPRRSSAASRRRGSRGSRARR
ncbi:MAG TPA: GNAT family N-acetyltransferase [Thermoplasmata archaeon]|nr:GNAT family N-acetyltransferase [Thermoplasmata archaeon]